MVLPDLLSKAREATQSAPMGCRVRRISRSFLYSVEMLELPLLLLTQCFCLLRCTLPPGKNVNAQECQSIGCEATEKVCTDVGGTMSHLRIHNLFADTFLALAGANFRPSEWNGHCEDWPEDVDIRRASVGCPFGVLLSFLP